MEQQFTKDELIDIEFLINDKHETIRNMDKIEPWEKGTAIYEWRVNLEKLLEKVRKM